MAENKEYITLKEAAKISGYAPDYIGQLIRSGKLHGKQVFLNVAWMTTREAIEQYALKEGKEANASFPFGLAEKPLVSLEFLSSIYSKIAWVGIGLSVAFLLFLFAILSVTLDHKIEQKYIDKMQHVE